MFITCNIVDFRSVLTSRFFFQAKNFSGKQLFTALNAEFEPIASIIRSEDMYENYLYEVSAIRGVFTKYGNKVVVDLPGYGTLYLPSRYVKRFLSDGSDPRRLNISCQNTMLKLTGREDDKYKTPIYEFINNIEAEDDIDAQPQAKKKRTDSTTPNGKHT